MNKSRIIWWGALGLLVAVAAIDRRATRRQLDDLRHRYNVIADAEASRADDAGDATRAQLALLARAANATFVVPPAIASPPRTSESATSDPQPQPTPKKVEAPSYAEHAAHIDKVISQESRDPNWSQGAESQLATALAPLAAGNGRIANVTCGSTVCRVRVEDTSEDALRDLVNQIFAARDKSGYWKGTMFTAHDPASPPDTFANVVYFAKENHPIPFIVN
jgi:hypothetical protein